MNIVDQTIGILAPHNCAGCGHEDDLLCYEYDTALKPVPSCCYSCHKITVDAFTCSLCKPASSLTRVMQAVAYEGVAKELVWQLKFQAPKLPPTHELAQLFSWTML